MKRWFGLLLALSLLLPLCQTAVPAPAHHAKSAATITATITAAAGQVHCPADAPDRSYCTPQVDPQLNVQSIAPRPDAAGAYGAPPASSAGTGRASASQQARAPDLHALSISRT